MLKFIDLIILASCLVVSVASGAIISCKNVKQISFEEMEQPGNICHFLQERGEIGGPSAGHDKIETCFCNLINKDFIWSKMLDKHVTKLYSTIVERLELGQNGYFNLKRRLSSKKEVVLDALEWGPRTDTRRFVAKMKHFPVKKIQQPCEQLVGEFANFLHLFDNFDYFMGNEDLRKQIISHQPKLESIFVTYIVCNRLGYTGAIVS